jgi:hypothetical protein
MLFASRKATTPSIFYKNDLKGYSCRKIKIIKKSSAKLPMRLRRPFDQCNN